MPRLMAASVSRSSSRLRIMCSIALPSAPTRLAAGTRQPENTSSAVGDARMPSLPLMRWPRLKPGMPFSTMNMESSRRPAPATRA